MIIIVISELNNKFEFQIELKVAENANNNKTFSNSIFILSFKFDGILTWLAIILSIALYFYPPAGKLNFVFLVFDVMLFTLNNHYIIGKSLSKHSIVNFNEFGVGPLGQVIFLLKLIPLISYLIKNGLKKF